MFCEKCGNKLSEGEEICSNCGCKNSYIAKVDNGNDVQVAKGDKRMHYLGLGFAVAVVNSIVIYYLFMGLGAILSSFHIYNSVLSVIINIFLITFLVIAHFSFILTIAFTSISLYVNKSDKRFFKLSIIILVFSSIIYYLCACILPTFIPYIILIQI